MVSEASAAASSPTQVVAAAAGGGAGRGDAGPGGSRARHPCPFKLRFAAQREPGRSCVSLVKPLALPATVAGKLYARSPARGAVQGAEEEAREEGALRRVRDMFARGPRDKHDAPLLSSHEYGWWRGRLEAGAAGDRRFHHHVRDSAWLRARLRVLAADAALKHAAR